MSKHIIAFDGMPCAGKTTYIEECKKNHVGYTFFSETYVPIETGNTISESQIEKYAKEELNKKQELDKVHIAEKVILDRSFLSTLAFAYAKSKKGSADDYHFFSTFIENNLDKIIMPDVIIIFLISAQESIRRRQKLMQEDTLDIWTDEEFLTHMYDYYASGIYTPLIPQTKVVTIDTTNCPEDELYQRMEPLMNS